MLAANDSLCGCDADGCEGAQARNAEFCYLLYGLAARISRRDYPKDAEG